MKTDDLRQKLLATFQIEHREHVAQIRSLLALMAGTNAAEGAEFEEIFRRAHSLKGAARAVEIEPVERLAHRLETLFSRVREGACLFDERVGRVTRQVLDATEDCVTALAGGRPAETVEEALRAIGGVLGMADLPAPARPASGVPSPGPAFQPMETLRIPVENFEGLFRTAGNIGGETQRQDQIARSLDGLVANIARVEKLSAEAALAAATLRQRDGAGAVSGLEAVLATLESMERETRAITLEARRATRLQKYARWSLHRLGRQLQADVRKARMVPADSLLEGVRKMMRDLARDEGKQIRFDASCASIHADRRVLDALRDPILHLLRNAVSHGVEPAAVRIGKGRSPEGLVKLRIDAEGQNLSVTVEDDGAGVDFSRLAEVAAREGIRHDTQTELSRMLFRPGFSTAASVTSLSGRGMGLSVVQETARRLQGTVELEPVPGGGTRITLSVPLSIASYRLIVVRCGKQSFAIPMQHIESLRCFTGTDVESAAGAPVLTAGGKSVPLVNLDAMLGVSDIAGPAARHAVILRNGGACVAVAVDAILREADAVVQDVPLAAEFGGAVSSGAILDDGSIALVLDAAAIRPGLARPRPASLNQAAQLPEPEPRPQATILVVDDSLTTRALEKSILEAHGYRVRVAVDGLEALERLRQEPADLVISDIEMPRLDGFGLVHAMKQDTALEKIPVIVVTSVERREDRERGLAAGADAYIVKRRFDQEELLGVIRQVL